MTGKSVAPQPRSRSLYLLTAFGLFLLWSNSFIAASYLLGTETEVASFDWVSLSAARFLPIFPVCLVYCLTFGRKDTVRLVRQHPLRLAVCSMLAVPGYNLALYYGQQHGVPPPIASLTTALVPLFVMVLAAIFLDEALTVRKTVAFGVALLGLVLIALSKGDPGAVVDYGLTLAITALAPLSWSVYSILSKPISGAASPLVWTYLSIVIGSIPLLALAPVRGVEEMSRLTGWGWFALLYLSVLCTVIGYGIWTWLLRHLPASTVGFTVFLNPPLTTVSKVLLAALFPAGGGRRGGVREGSGGGRALGGLVLALWPQR